MTSGQPDAPVRVLRIIARMNIGGSAYHVSVLTRGLASRGYSQVLATGALGPGEGSLEHLVADINRCKVPGLRPELRPWDDLRALISLVRVIRRYRPDIVETHTAKAGVVGRLAALLARRPRPAIIHWYHGHVLTGYFPRPVTAFYRLVERRLARTSDRLVCVSEATMRELVSLGIAETERFAVVRLGLELRQFVDPDRGRVEQVRGELGASGAGTVLACYAGRLVPIKRVDLILRATARIRPLVPEFRLAIVGDGPLRSSLEACADELGIRDIVHFAGFRGDMEAVVGAMDIGVLASDNEGAGAALIEAAAGGRPVVATRVGGVPEVVERDRARLVPPDDADALATALAEAATDSEFLTPADERKRQRVVEEWAVDRLLMDMHALYASVLAERRAVA